MPIVEAVHAVLFRGQRAESAVTELLRRPTGVE
jgi:glycerol-3-phosphate dehydrogenase